MLKRLLAYLEKAISGLNAIPDDKVRHFAGGAILFSAGLIVGPRFAWCLLVGLAAAKECLYDASPWGQAHGHVADWKDFVATVLGGAPVLLAFLMGRLHA